MVSFRFPFSIPPLPTGIISPATIACSVALTAGISAGVADVAVKEEKSGVVFPGVVDGNKGLLGVGLRRKVLFGLKNIDVYAF
ncbi:fatty-acid-binding protein 1, partial [Tanacetum coccineum]